MINWYLNRLKSMSLPEIFFRIGQLLRSSYEQIFWLMTQKSIEQRRPAFKLMSRQGSSELIVRIHSNERYPWRFPDAINERGVIPTGDYALMDGDNNKFCPHLKMPESRHDNGSFTILPS